MAFSSQQGNYQQRGTNNSPVPALTPPPPIPQRARRSEPPPMGWNLTNLNTDCFNSGMNFQNPSDPFGSSFTGPSWSNINTVQASISKQTSSIPNQTSFTSDSHSLEGMQAMKSDQKSSTTGAFSMDLQGLTFDNTTTCSSETTEKTSQFSSTDNTITKTNSQAYPDISHAFRELRRDPTTAPVQSSWQPAGQMGSYGWNSELISPALNDPWLAINNQNVSSNRPPALPPRKSLSSDVPNMPMYPTNLQLGRGLVPVLPMHPSAYNVQNFSNQSSVPQLQHQFSQPYFPTVNPAVKENRPASIHGVNSLFPNRLNVPQSGLHRTPSGSEFDNLRKENKQTDDVFSDNFHNRDFVDDVGRPRSRRGSDLIELSDEEKEDFEREYLSLESFDPLYKRQRSESVSSKEGILTGSPQDGFPSFVFAEASNESLTVNEKLNSSLLYPQLPEEEEDEGVCPMVSHDELEKFLRSEIPQVEAESEAPPRPPPPKSKV